MRYLSQYYRYLIRKANAERIFPLIYWQDACGPWVFVAFVPLLLAAIFDIPKTEIVNAAILASMFVGGAGICFVASIYVREDWRRNAERRPDH